MNPRPTAVILLGFAMVALFFYLPAHCLHGLTGDSAKTMAVDWLDDHAEAAEQWATLALEHPTADRGEAPPCEKIRCFEDSVAFTLQTGSHLSPSKGVCWSGTGTPPAVGWGDSLPHVWVHLSDGWYAWAAE